MTHDELINGLKTLALAASEKTNGAKWYLFGSALNNPNTAADIDLVIVCASDEDADLIRHKINSSDSHRPIHPSIFTYVEAIEMNLAQSKEHFQFY